MADSAQERRTVEIVIVSDGTGETAGALVRAAMLQFQSPWHVRVFSDVRQPSQVQRPVEQAAQTQALLAFTLVNKQVAQALREAAADRGVAVVDLLGPLIASAGEHLRADPRGTPGLLHGFSDEYFRRIEAVEFAVRHDDGANMHELFKADLVLTGVSRTSKTPLSMYLAQRGYKTGNVPLVPSLDPPRELLELDPRKVIGLTVSAELLENVRLARAKRLGALPYSAYTDPDAMLQELQRARRLFRTHGWQVVDISGRAVEENAARILDLLDN